MSTAWGTIFGIRGLQRLIDESQIIVVGDVLDGSEAATLATATVLVTRVLAGDVTAGSVIPVIYSHTGPVVARKLTRDRGLFFISQHDGQSEIVPRLIGDVPFSFTYFRLAGNALPAAYAYSAQDLTLDKVVLEFAASAEADPAGTRGTDASAVLVQPPLSSRVASVYNRFIQSSDKRLRLVGLQGLLGAGDLGTLVTVEHDEESIFAGRETDVLWRRIAQSFRATTQESLAILSRLATRAKTAQLQRAAAWALGATNARETLPILAQLLDSTDTELQQAACLGFTRFAFNVPTGSHQPVPGYWPFRTEETRQHSGDSPKNAVFWKNWWLRNQEVIRSGQIPAQPAPSGLPPTVPGRKP